MKTAAAYIRVSTDMQTELSPDSQLHMIRQYAEQHDMLLSNSYIFSDDGISGRTAKKRPGFQQMIAVAKQKPTPFDVILVWKFSRFARSREDSIVYKSMLRKQCGIEVISITEPTGEDKTSILMESMLEAMDEYYSINLAEEVRRGMEEKIRRGGIVSSPPIGYVIKNGKYVIEKTEAEVVRKIFSDYINGKGTRTIATEINSMGLRTKRGNKFECRNIEYILTNTIYIGKLRYCPSHKCTTSNCYNMSEDTIVVDDFCEKIIDDNIFERTQKKYRENKNKYAKYYRQRSPQENDYYFRGIVRCSTCGSTLTQSAAGQGMQCYSYAHGTCTKSHYISFAKLKKAVFAALENDSNTESKITFIEKPNTDVQYNSDSMIKEQIEKEQKRLERIKAAYEDGIDSLEEYKTAKVKITENINNLRLKLSESDVSVPEINITEYKNKIAQTLIFLKASDLPPAEFNSVLLTIVSQIVFDRGKNEITIFYK